ncbi:MAG TPA: MFS transporter, partial [Burkholderiaceae bacterium]|nr:MFS transporter [Burkholderiaceae bacterium]
MKIGFARIIVFVVMTHTAFGAARLSSSLYALSNGASAFTVGVVMALFALVPALLAVRAGRWLDRVGPLPPMLLGTSLMTLGALLPAVFPYATADVAPLLVGAALLGTGFMYLQMTAQNLVGTLADPARRPAAFSMLALGFSTSGLIAPVASGFLIDAVGHRATFAAVFLLLMTSLALLIAQRHRLPAHDGHARGSENTSPFELLLHPEVRAVLIVSGLISMSWDMQSFLVPV